MLSRLASFSLLFFLTVPLFSQQAGMGNRVDQWIWSRGKMMRADTPPELDTRAVRLEAMHRDADELSALSVSVQSDLQQLQHGLLPKDLDQKLRKMEKLSKRLRGEVGQ